jgi:putative transcriptional regulator
MTVRQLPSDEIMLAYAAGTLSAAHALVVETHLALHAQSREWAGKLETLGGLLLADLPPAPVDTEALQRALARIEVDPRQPTPSADDDPEIASFPEPLRRYAMTPWKTAGRGTLIRRVLTPEDGDNRVIMFKIDPGRKMPQHTHSGLELTCVIAGSYSDEVGRYGPGDFEEADSDISHRPVIDSDVPCICVVALTGKVTLEGFLGRLLQPFVRL